MTEEITYYTGGCITDLHTDTSFSCNEEKCKQYIKSDGLNFCMSSVCPEKDCIYALVNKLHQTIDRLEQENKELKKDVQLFKCLDTFGESECHCACRCLGNEFCEDADKKINSYRSALEEIKKILDKECSIVSNAKAVGIINEVLNDK